MPDEFALHDSHDALATGGTLKKTILSRLAPGVETTDLSDNPTLPNGRDLGKDESLGNYRIEKILGRGGMGVVYLATQEGLDRQVAVKVLNAGDKNDALDRFLAESRSAASIRHPNVVEVHHFGTARGRPFLVFEYCPGGNLGQRIEAGEAFATRAAAGLLAKVADGVEAAHAHGIVHRDVKPHNVLLTECGEPKVTDFGLAKWGTLSDLTKSNVIMGTPHYMSPEQAKGKTKFVGPQADVWALGVILYELLTGTKPFPGEEIWAILARVVGGNFVIPRKVNPAVPRDLERICLKCLSPEPHARYETAGGLADDLRRWLGGEPIRARPAGPVERLGKAAGRNPAVAAALGVAVVTLLAATATSSWLAVRATRAEEAATHQLAQTRRAEKAAVVLSCEVQTSLAKSVALADQLQTSLDESRRRATLNYLAYGQMCAAASRVAHAPDRDAAQHLADEYTRIVQWVTQAADPRIRGAIADFDAEFAKWAPDGPSPPQLKRKSLDLAKACKASWMNSVEKEFPELAVVVRQRLYQRAVSVAGRLAQPGRPHRLAQAHQEFWELYWGELAIVESPQVEGAMVELGRVLQAWPDDAPPPPALAMRVANLRLACGAR